MLTCPHAHSPAPSSLSTGLSPASLAGTAELPQPQPVKGPRLPLSRGCWGCWAESPYCWALRHRLGLESPGHPRGEVPQPPWGTRFLFGDDQRCAHSNLPRPCLARRHMVRVGAAPGLWVPAPDTPPFLCTKLISISSAETSAVCKWPRLLPLDDLAPTLPVQAGKIHSVYGRGWSTAFVQQGLKITWKQHRPRKNLLSSHRTAQLSLPTAWKKSPLLLMLATSRAVAGKHTRAEPRTY